MLTKTGGVGDGNPCEGCVQNNSLRRTCCLLKASGEFNQHPPKVTDHPKGQLEAIRNKRKESLCPSPFPLSCDGPSLTFIVS